MDILKEYYSNNFLPEDLLWGKEYRFLKKEVRLIESQIKSYTTDFVISFSKISPCENPKYSKVIMCKNGEVTLPFSTFEDFLNRWEKFKKLGAFI